MANIIFRDVSEHGPAELCKPLCDALMQHQTDRGVRYKNILASMCFENRLKPAFDAAERRFLYIAFDENKPVGYIFCEGGTVTEEMKTARPDWANMFPADAGNLYPGDLPTPIVVAHLNNLYVLPEYRGQHISGELMAKGMSWMKSIPGVERAFVHVSNGNNAGALYEKYGFRYSHDVYNGMIDAYQLVY